MFVGRAGKRLPNSVSRSHLSAYADVEDRTATISGMQSGFIGNRRSSEIRHPWNQHLQVRNLSLQELQVLNLEWENSVVGLAVLAAEALDGPFVQPVCFLVVYYGRV